VRALFDVNVLVALHDPQHVHHDIAVDWLEAHAADGWASCPITQNGCLRVLSLPVYPNARRAGELIVALRPSFAGELHEFWFDDISLMQNGVLLADHVHGHRQLTDLYLLALAVHHKGCFVTFDARIPVSAVMGARSEQLVLLTA
jgi:toxin-antitoxin system PIN domain toxin